MIKLNVFLFFVIALSILISSLVVAADCAVWPCNCGDSLTSSVTMTSDLECYSDNGLIFGSDYISLDCENYRIIGNISLKKNGILISYNNTEVKNCNISDFYNGIVSGESSLNVTILNNTISPFGVYGIEIGGGSYYSYNVSVINNTIGNDARVNPIGGISLSHLNDSIITGNIVQHVSTDGLRSRYVEYSVFSDNSYNNVSTGYYFGYSSNNYFFSEAITNTTNGIEYSESLNDNNTYFNVIFSSNNIDLNISSGSSENITLINCSINKSKLFVDYGVEAFFKWFVDVNVTDTSGNALSGATVIAYDSTGEVEQNVSTGFDGIAQLNLTEFYRENEVNYYLVPHNIVVYKENYTENSTSVNLLNQTGGQANLSINSVGCGDTVYNNFYFGNNYSCDDSILVVGSDNVIITGNDYTLTGTGTSTAINLSGVANITISDLTITNFTEAINLYQSNNSNITKVTLLNNTFGIIFNNSNNTKVYETTSRNNTYNVYAINDGETSNYLINSSIGVDNITVSGTASVFVQWYVDVNAAYNDGLKLSGGNASAFFNDTGELDDTKTTDSEGKARLIVTELKKNATGVFYLTPNNISLQFSTSTQDVENSTVINISETNRTEINLSLTLDCTTPFIGMNITNDTTFCPGTFSVNDIIVDIDNLNITCDDTNFVNPSSENSIAFYVYGDNIKIQNCSYSDYFVSVIVQNADNFTLSGTSFSDCETTSGGVCIQFVNSHYGNLTNFSMINSQFLISLTFSNLTFITNGVLELASIDAIRMVHASNNIITNNSFNNNGFSGIRIAGDSINNSFYHNRFSNQESYFFYSPSSDPGNFNTSINGYPQGNTYDDYCDKGLDTNGDGYADAVSSEAAADWPYNATVSSKIYESTAGSVIDYGPKIQSCPTDVFLGGGSAGGSSSSAGAGGAGAATPVATPTTTAPKRTSTEVYTADEASKYLKKGITTQKVDAKTTKVTVTLENTGTQSMQLFPDLFQETDDPFYIVTKKTMGYEGSLFSKLAGISYSEDSVAGRLLQAKILNPEEIVLQPGEKIEKVLQIEEGLIAPRTIKIQFTTLGEVVTEQEVEIEQKSVSGTAIDIDKENSLIDIYALIVPAEFYEEVPQETIKNAITGGAVTNIQPGKNEYILEVNINKGKSTLFGDVYGPYSIKEAQAFIFAQQLKYDHSIYTGDLTLTTKIYRNGEETVQNEFSDVFE